MQVLTEQYVCVYVTKVGSLLHIWASNVIDSKECSVVMKGWSLFHSLLAKHKLNTPLF